MPLTTFGRLAGYYRVDHQMTLKEMAASLGLNATALAAVEKGERPVPPEWIDLLPEKLAIAVIDATIADHEKAITELRDKRVKLTTKTRGGIPVVSAAP